MVILIKKWPNGTATLITEMGQVLSTFTTVEDAKSACQEWEDIQNETMEVREINNCAMEQAIGL